MSAAVWQHDTNILLAATIAPERLPDEIAELLRDPDKTVSFSTASLWEVAIKRLLNRKSFDFNPADAHQLAVETGFA
jgi:PIN domain nuclease of toxin-antitoxin system